MVAIRKGIVNDIPRSETGKVGFETFYLENGIVWRGGIMNWGLGLDIALAEKLSRIEEDLEGKLRLRRMFLKWQL